MFFHRLSSLFFINICCLFVFRDAIKLIVVLVFSDKPHDNMDKFVFHIVQCKLRGFFPFL